MPPGDATVTSTITSKGQRAAGHSRGPDRGQHRHHDHDDLLVKGERHAEDLGQEHHGHALEQGGPVHVHGRARRQHEPGHRRRDAQFSPPPP